MKFLFLPIWLLALIPLATEAGTVAVPIGCKEGGMLHAIDRAYKDFSTFLLESTSGSLKGELRTFLAEINNYEIRATLERNKYIIKFLPYGYPGGVVKGGGAKYTINKCTFQIEEIQGRQPLE